MTWATHYDADTCDHYHASAAKPYRAEICSLIELFHPTRVLEIGCGPGAQRLAMIANRLIGVEYYGVDCSPEAIAFARALHVPGRFYRADASDPELLDSLAEEHGPFDVIFSVYAMCYLQGGNPMAWALRHAQSAVIPAEPSSTGQEYLCQYGPYPEWHRNYHKLFRGSPHHRLWISNLRQPVDHLTDVTVWERKREEKSE